MPTTQRLLTDTTGQALVTAVNNIVAAVKPNATEIQMSSSDTTTVATAITNINNKIGTVPSGQTVEGQITTLNSKIATQSATVAKANANYTYGNVKFEKTANCVSVMIEGFVSLPAQGYTVICAIPTGFAPSAIKYFDVVVGTNETGANLRTIRFKMNETTLSVYNYSTELTNVNAQPFIMYTR